MTLDIKLMNRFFIMICSLFVMQSFGACSSDAHQLEETLPSEENNEGYDNGTASPDVTNEDILIVYFSRAGENWNVEYVDRGNTAVMADYIQEYTGAATFEIVPEVPYPTDYATMLQVSQQERDTDARPAIKNPLENLNQYSIVFIGSPIWYGGPPMIMQTFYEAYPDLASKILVPFGTHGGSGINSCARLIREYFPEAQLLESFGISGEHIRSSRDDVEVWLEKIGFTRNERN